MRRREARWVAAAVAAAILIAAGFLWPPTGLAGERAPMRCARRPVLADVYHPWRLKVLKRCVVVEGTVAFVRREPDGDLHVNLRVSNRRLLDWPNFRWEHGDLVLEMVPADRAGCGPVGAPARVPATAYRGPSYHYGRCSGLDVGAPKPGARVEVAGPYVLDRDHGWREIHPVEALRVIR